MQIRRFLRNHSASIQSKQMQQREGDTSGLPRDAKSALHQDARYAKSFLFGEDGFEAMSSAIHYMSIGIGM
jgi:hypothetical protein